MNSTYLLDYLKNFPSNFKTFFNLFWESFNVTTLLSSILATLICFFYKTDQNIFVSAFVFVFSLITINSVQLRKKYGLSLLGLLKPISTIPLILRLVYYWNVLGFTLILTGIVIRAEEVISMHKFVVLFHLVFLFVGLVLLIKNMFLTVFYGFDQCKLDWLFMSLFYGCLMVIYWGMCAAVGLNASGPNIGILWSVGLTFRRVTETIVLGGAAALGTAIVNDSYVALKEVAKELYNQGREAGRLEVLNEIQEQTTRQVETSATATSQPEESQPKTATSR